MMVRKDAQRRGVGSRLLRYGTDQADAEGIKAYLNGTTQGKALYEHGGFKVAEKTEFGLPGIISYHMVRDANAAVQ